MVHENKTVLVDLPGTLGYDWTTAATKHWWNTFSELHVKHCCTYMCSELCKLSPSNCSPSMATSNLNSILNLDNNMAQNVFFLWKKNQEAWANSTLAGMLTAHETEAIWRTHGPISGSPFNSRQPMASQLILTLSPWGSTTGSSIQQWSGFD